jgi:hypothetical protein
MIRTNLIHSATLKTKTGTTQSSTGHLTPTYSTSTVACLFASPKGNVLDLESGKHSQKNPIVYFDVGVSISTSSKITTTEEGWSGEYNVLEVSPYESRFGIEFYVAEVEKIE